MKKKTQENFFFDAFSPDSRACFPDSPDGERRREAPLPSVERVKAAGLTVS